MHFALMGAFLGGFSANALEFGKMGNRASTMGNAGVALKGQYFGTYYNPALLGATNNVALALTTGFGVQQENVGRLISGFKNITSLADSFKSVNTSNPKSVRELYEKAKDLDDILTRNYINANANIGATFEFSPAFIRGVVGSFGASYYSNLQIGASVDLGSLPSDIVVKTSNNNYVALHSNGKTSSSDANAYKNTALGKLQEQSQYGDVKVYNFIFTEIPVSYSYTFYFLDSMLTIGANAKYQKATFIQQGDTKNNSKDDVKISFPDTSDFTKSITDLINKEGKSGFNADIGVLYGLDLPVVSGVNIGLVAKNIIPQNYSFEKQKLIIKPQYRAGVAINQGIISAALDVDLMPNEVIAFSSKKNLSQQIGTGVNIDLGIIDMRLGGFYDVRANSGIVLTGGLGLFGIIDAGVQVATSADRFGQKPIPRYFSFQLEGGFRF